MKRRVMKLDEIREISSYFQETHDKIGRAHV